MNNINSQIKLCLYFSLIMVFSLISSSIVNASAIVRMEDLMFLRQSAAGMVLEEDISGKLFSAQSFFLWDDQSKDRLNT